MISSFTVEPLIKDTFGTSLYREVVLFWRWFYTGCVTRVLLAYPLLGGLSSFRVSFIGGFTVFPLKICFLRPYFFTFFFTTPFGYQTQVLYCYCRYSEAVSVESLAAAVYRGHGSVPGQPAWTDGRVRGTICTDRLHPPHQQEFQTNPFSAAEKTRSLGLN